MESSDVGKMQADKDVEGLIRSLKDKDPAVRENAAKALGEMNIFITPTAFCRSSAGLWYESLVMPERMPHVFIASKYTKINLECRRSISYTSRGNLAAGISRIATTFFETACFYVQLPSLMTPSSRTTKHIVECPACENMLGFDIVPAGHDDKRRKTTLWSHFHKSDLSKPGCFLTWGQKCNGGDWYTHEFSCDDSDSRACYFHSVKSLELGTYRP